MKQLFFILAVFMTGCNSKPSIMLSRPAGLHIYINGLGQYVVGDGSGKFAHPVYREGRNWEFFNDMAPLIPYNDTEIIDVPYPCKTLAEAQQLLMGAYRKKEVEDSLKDDAAKKTRSRDSLMRLAGQYKLVQ